jgi:hypothetical protein
VTHCLAINSKELKAGLKLSSKEFIVAEIITRFKISKGVAGRGRHHLKSSTLSCGASKVILGARRTLPVQNSSRGSPVFCGSTEPLVVISTALLQQLERVLLEPATELPEPHLKTVADGRKRDRALLSLA